MQRNGNATSSNLKAFDPACYAALASGMTDVRHLVQSTKGRKSLSKALQLQPSFAKLALNYNDIEFFYAVLASVFSVPVVNNRINSGVYSTSAGLSDICAVLNDASTAGDGVRRIVNATKYVVSTVTGTDFGGLPNSYDTVVGALKTEDGNDARLAFYQLCSEFG
jgi:Serine carboxypeptidase S28